MVESAEDNEQRKHQWQKKKKDGNGQRGDAKAMSEKADKNGTPNDSCQRKEVDTVKGPQAVKEKNEYNKDMINEEQHIS